MDKNQIINQRTLYRITEIMTRQSRGAYWVSFLQTYFDITKVILYSGMIKILIPQVPTIPLMIVASIGMFLVEIVKYYIGKYDEQKGIWSKQSEYGQKKEHLAPFNCELRDTLKEICKKLEIENKFKDL